MTPHHTPPPSYFLRGLGKNLPLPLVSPGPAMDSTAKNEMQPALIPGMSPVLVGWERDVARKMGMVGLGPPCQVCLELYRPVRGVDCPGGQAEEPEGEQVWQLLPSSPALLTWLSRLFLPRA